MICSGEPFAERIPSASAATRSSIPNAFQVQTNALPCPRSASQATGKANAPVMTSPQPAEYGNGPASLPSAARRRKNPPAKRQTFRPIRRGIGIPSSEPRTDDEIDAATAVATLRDLDQVLGVLPDDADDLDADTLAMLAERETARAARDWASSDRLRDALADRGIAVEDTRDGQRWRRLVESGRG